MDSSLWPLLSSLWFSVANHTFTSAEFRYWENPRPICIPPQASRGPHADLPGHAPAETCCSAAHSHCLQQIPPAECVYCSPDSVETCRAWLPRSEAAWRTCGPPCVNLYVSVCTISLLSPRRVLWWRLGVKTVISPMPKKKKSEKDIPFISAAHEQQVSYSQVLKVLRRLVKLTPEIQMSYTR